jgi:hypothetical protein
MRSSHSTQWSVSRTVEFGRTGSLGCDEQLYRVVAENSVRTWICLCLRATKRLGANDSNGCVAV